MIKNFLITGDTHGRVIERLSHIENKYVPEETALIILGDAGINFYLNKTDAKNKKNINATGYTIYCVRGNHEERPENIPTMKELYDENIDGTVYYEPQYPNIRYLMDGHVYLINKYPTLIIGGAYSVDKWYRLSRFPQGSKWTGWFKDEQLTQEEMVDITERFKGKHFDFILTHTCPYSWQPFDLFLQGLDQSTVDNTMERWLDDFRKQVTWNVWCFGHFHDDRAVRPGVEMFYSDIVSIDEIYDVWTSGKELPYYYTKDPNYDKEDDV